MVSFFCEIMSKLKRKQCRVYLVGATMLKPFTTVNTLIFTYREFYWKFYLSECIGRNFHTDFKLDLPVSLSKQHFKQYSAWIRLYESYFFHWFTGMQYKNCLCVLWTSVYWDFGLSLRPHYKSDCNGRNGYSYFIEVHEKKSHCIAVTLCTLQSVKSLYT